MNHSSSMPAFVFCVLSLRHREKQRTLVPTLCAGTFGPTLCVIRRLVFEAWPPGFMTQSVWAGIPTQSVGTRVLFRLLSFLSSLCLCASVVRTNFPAPTSFTFEP